MIPAFQRWAKLLHFHKHYGLEIFRQIINFLLSLCPSNISTSDERCFNVVDQLWNNVDPTLKTKQIRMLDFQRSTSLIQRRCPTLKQSYTKLKKSYIATNQDNGKCGFVTRQLSFNIFHNIFPIQVQYKETVETVIRLK